VQNIQPFIPGERYLKLILQRVRENWYSLIPESAQMKHGKVVIEFAIIKDGNLRGMKLVPSSGEASGLNIAPSASGDTSRVADDRANRGGTSFNRPQLPKSMLLRLLPGSRARPPSIYVPAVFLVFCPEFPTQSRLFVKDYEQMNAEGNGDHDRNSQRVSVPEHNPQADPARREAQVHGVPHVAVEAHNDQALGRSDRGWCATSRPTEVPNAAEGDSETQH
jgi:hypothetical protein